MSKVKLSDRQVHALRWLLRPDGSTDEFRVWSKMSVFSPDVRALTSCVKRGLAQQTDLPSWRRYAITDLGRAALAQHERSQTEG